MASLSCVDKFLSRDPTLLKDVAEMKPSDVLALTRRLEAASKSLTQLSSTLYSNGDGVHFISQLAQSFFEAAENTRIARGLEKMLAATGPGCEAVVRTELATQLLSCLQGLSKTAKELKKVCGLLEHSKLVQREMGQHTPVLLEQLSLVFCDLLGCLPVQLNRERADKLYYTVKLCLQLFQQMPDVRQQGWICLKHLISQDTINTGSDRPHDPLTLIVNGILAVLIRKNYAREVILLAGTAVSMVINAAATPEECASAFFAVHSIVTRRTPLQALANLRLSSSATLEDSGDSHLNHTAEISLLRNILLGSTQTVLCCSVNKINTNPNVQNVMITQTQPFLLSLFPLVCELCEAGSEFQYLSFHLLSVWMQKLSSCLLDLTQNRDCSMGKDCVTQNLDRLNNSETQNRDGVMDSATQSHDHVTDSETQSHDRVMDSVTQSHDCLMSTVTQNHKRLMSKDSVIISETLKKVWLSLDSPVDGVSEFAADVLKTFLDVWSVEVANGRSDYVDLAEELMRKVIQVPWYARSRYKPLSLLIPYIDVDKLLRDSECLKSQLLDCMGANFLSALASDVYTAFLLAVRDGQRIEDQADRWEKHWLTTLVSGLTSPDSLIRNKVCAYWLSSTLKILPCTQALIQRHLEERLSNMKDNSVYSRFLFAWVAACRIIRNVAELELTTLSEQLLTQAIYSDEEDICSEALALLSSTQKKAEPLGQVEIGMLKAALPHCLKVDSAPFRQKLVTSLRKVFVRVRDSCGTAIKRKTHAVFVDPSLHFMEWLYRLVMTNLVPGACFQRRRTCLDIVQAWLETIVFVETDGAKKGKAQGPTDVLMKYAESKKLWDFFSHDDRVSLLYCVVDGADEIQESAVHILKKYYPWDLPDESGTGASCNLDLATHLLRQGLELCDSPRAYENHSGALLVRLVYEKFVKEQGVQFDVSEEISVDSDVCRQGNFRSHKTDSETRQACVSFFTNILLHRTQSYLTASEKDALLASKSSPVHGVLQALCECLRAEQDGSVLCAKDWGDILSSLVALSSSTVTLMLHILADGQAGNCPSFAQMGMALEQLLTADGAAEQEVTSSISPEFQLLLSWCWLNLKESCTCLGMAAKLSVTCNKGTGLILPQSTIEQIGDIFLNVLTHCRHRGAIEGCRNGFLQFCMSLMTCDDSILSAIPANILNKVLNSLEKDEMTSSVTRRSAGLPIIVQTIAQAEKRCKSNKLLQATVNRLYSVASQPPCSQSDQKQDQAPVHALNILKALFSDASLAGELLSHLGKMMQLVICSFESSSWAVRNSATQLVSTLVTRMFGQRNKAQLVCNMMTLREWSAHFPELLSFVSGKMEESLQAGDAITAVQPSLFLVLTLLASLGPAAESSQCHSLTSSLRSTVMGAVSSPVHYLRELSASVVVSLTPLDATDSCVCELLLRLRPESQHSHSSNSVHGTLMCLHKLLTSRTLSPNVAEEIVQQILNNTTLLAVTEQCLLLSAKCAEVLSKAVPMLSAESSLKSRLLEILLTVLFLSSAGGQSLQVGRTLFVQSVISLIISLLQSFSPSSPLSPLSIADFVYRCLDSEDVEIRRAMLDCLCRHDDHVLLDCERKRIQTKLWQCVKQETDPTCIISASTLLTTYHLDNSSSSPADLLFHLRIHDLAEVRSRFSGLAKVQTALFPVETVILSRLVDSWKKTGVDDDVQSSLCAWSEHLTEFSQPYQNEDFRMAAAQAVALAGQSTLTACAQSLGIVMESVTIRFVEVCMSLLEDTDTDVRKLVADFVACLQWQHKHPQICHMNANLCSKVLLSYLCGELGKGSAVRQLLFNMLYTPGQLYAAVSKLTQPRTQYLFEPEENTFYSEKIQQQLDIYQALKKTQTKADDTSAPVLSSLLEELRRVLPALHTCTEQNPVFNMCGDEGVLAAMTGLSIQLLLLSHGTNMQDPHRDGLHSLASQVSIELNNLLQIPHLHPAVKSLLQTS